MTELHKHFKRPINIFENMKIKRSINRRLEFGGEHTEEYIVNCISEIDIMLLININPINLV